MAPIDALIVACIDLAIVGFFAFGPLALLLLGFAVVLIRR